MEIHVKYDIGDVIRYIYKKKIQMWRKCPFCQGEGEIQGANEEQADCPKCKGDKKVYDGYVYEESEKEGTISRVTVNYDSAFDKKPVIYYNVPQNIYNIMQEDIIEKVFTDEEKLAYSD